MCSLVGGHRGRHVANAIVGDSDVETIGGFLRLKFGCITQPSGGFLILVWNFGPFGRAGHGRSHFCLPCNSQRTWTPQLLLSAEYFSDYQASRFRQLTELL